MCAEHAIQFYYANSNLFFFFNCFLATGTRKFFPVWEFCWQWTFSWSGVTLTSQCLCLPGEKNSRDLMYPSQVREGECTWCQEQFLLSKITFP